MNKIKEVLVEKGIKQTWLAEQLGKSYNMVNGYVQNRQQPRLEVLFEIAKILGVKPQELLERDKMTSIIQRQELQNKIWKIANEVRGSVDGWDFKQFVLGTLFYLIISVKTTQAFRR